MTTLEDLYYGNISPHERYIKRGTRVDKLVKLICKNEEELNSGLTEKQKETFEKFKDCTSELSCITEREAFSAGFILATRIMAEVMQGLEQVEDSLLFSRKLYDLIFTQCSYQKVLIFHFYFSPILLMTFVNG